MVNQITLDEIYERGIELPREMFTFPVCEFIRYEDGLGNLGGIYCFHNDTEGWLYVGISAFLKRRLKDHIQGQGGNQRLYEKIKEPNNNILTIYREQNESLREFYENYLILKHNPKYNTAKKSKLKDGFSMARHSPQTQNEVIRLYSSGIGWRTIEEDTGVRQNLQGRILDYNGVPRNHTSKLSKFERLKRNEKIIEQYKAGRTSAQIAESMKINKSAVHHVVYKHFDKPPKEQPIAKARERNKLILEMALSSGKSQAQVASEFNVTKSTVYSLLKRYRNNNDIQVTSSKTEERDLEIMRLYGEGLKATEIAKVFDLTPNTIRFIRRKHNRMREELQ